MNSMMRLVISDIAIFPTDTWVMVANGFVLIVLFSLAAFCVSSFAAQKWGGSRGKTAVGFVGITLAFTVLLIGLFGCSAITVRGSIFCLILLLSSYSDIRTRECSDWLHVMIVIAAFIGCDFVHLPMMLVSAMFVGGVMLMAILTTNCPIGGADIKCAVACSFLLGFEKGVAAFVGGMLLAVLINAFKNKEKRRGGFPLIPCLAVGYLAVFLI